MSMIKLFEELKNEDLHFHYNFALDGTLEISKGNPFDGIEKVANIFEKNHKFAVQNIKTSEEIETDWKGVIEIMKEILK